MGTAGEAVHVAGFVDVAACPKADPELKLDASVWARHLPLSAALPLSIEHLEDSQVGWVTGLFPAADGLLCTGVVCAPEFLELLDSLYAESAVARRPPGDASLPRNPRAEVMHAWLPELSLSSLRPEDVRPDVPVFDHVSLCALGRRRGSVAVYGDSLEWVLARFQALSAADAAGIAAAALALPVPPPPRFGARIQSLFAKAIDAGFIANRLTLLRADRVAARVSPATYLKASETEALSATPSAPLSPACIESDVPRAAMSSGHAAGEDTIPVPRSTFLNMLESTVARAHAAAPAPPAQPCSHYPFFSAPFGAVPAGVAPKYRPMGPFFLPGDYPVDAPYTHFAPRAPPSPDYAPRGACDSPHWRARTHKRKRDDDEALFPGEEATVFKKDISLLSKSISEIQSELRALRQCQQASYAALPAYGMYAPPAPPPEPHPCAAATAAARAAESAPPPAATGDDGSSERPVRNTVDASCKPSPQPSAARNLQKIFCDELLNKQ